MPVRRFYRICSSDQNRIICAAGALIRGLRGGQDPKAFLYRRQLKFWCPQRSPVSPPLSQRQVSSGSNYRAITNGSPGQVFSCRRRP
jgi:hypothetical protein